VDHGIQVSEFVGQHVLMAPPLTLQTQKSHFLLTTEQDMQT